MSGLLKYKSMHIAAPLHDYQSLVRRAGIKKEFSSKIAAFRTVQDTTLLGTLKFLLT